jgi:hypothetical protein
MRSSAIPSALVVVLAASLMQLVSGVVPAAADGVELVFTSEPGCYEAEWYSVGLKGDGEGSIDIAPGPGPVVFASLAWTGTDDTTPDDVTPGGGRADSSLILNGVSVVGRQPTGAAGFAPTPDTTWYAWSARIGPDTLGIVDKDTTRLDVSGWDGGPGPTYQRNGALLSIIYDTSPCLEPKVIQEYEGVDYFYEGFGQPHSDTVFVPVMNSIEETTLSLPFGLAGSQVDFVGCRGIGLWYLAGSGATPAYGAFDLVDDSGATGFGINGGVEIVNDPFSHPSGTCTAKLNQAPPDVSYAAGHPYPGGAATAPYRAASIRPPRGPAPRADIALSVIDVVIPPGSDWIAFQFESEPEEGGESGAWVASQTFLKPVVGAIGDRVWSDSNQNCLQDAGEAGIGAVTVTLFDDGGNAIASTETAADGSYVFSGLLAGSYSVEFDVPTGFELTEPNCTDDLRDSDAVLTGAARGRTGTIVLPGGSSDFSVDAGLITAPPPTTVPVTTVPVTTVPVTTVPVTTVPPPVDPDGPPALLANSGSSSSSLLLYAGVSMVLGAVFLSRSRWVPAPSHRD